MDLTAFSKISSIIGFLLIAISSPSRADSHFVEEVTRKLIWNSTSPAEAPSIIYAGVGEDIKLICDVGGINEASASSKTPLWSFMRSGKLVYDDVRSHCVENSETGADQENNSSEEHVSSKENENESVLDCEVKFDKDHSHLILELEKLKENQFGDYICHFGNSQLMNATFPLREILTLARKNEKGKIQKSVTLDEYTTLELYCNATGLKDYHVISWFKDEENITDDLNNGLGLFENFTRTNHLQFHGTATLEHRGNYTCQVDLSAFGKRRFPKLLAEYPVAFTFYARVKEWDRWKLPVYILVGEAVLIILFTMFLNWREKRSEEVDAGDVESDDESEAQTEKNGTQNSNGSNKGK